MKLQLTKTFCNLFFICFVSIVCAQEGVVSGVLTGNDGVPIPGVSILVKGTTHGVTSNFDGEYKITCKIGDILVFSFIGMLPKEVEVTSNMFGESSTTIVTKQKPVEQIKNDAFQKAVSQFKKASVMFPSLEHTSRTYNKTGYFQYNRIKDIEIEDDQVKLTYFKPNFYFEVRYNTIKGIQYVKNSNLPQTQNIFSQGLFQNGELRFSGPETNNIFSYGPRLNTLEFDGSNYAYDINGRLVPINNGNGTPASTYDNSIFEPSIKSVDNVSFNVSSDYSLFGFEFTSKNQKDLYNRETNKTNNLLIQFKNYIRRQKKLAWDAFVKYDTQTNNQPNINGFQNNLLLNSLATPVSFDNKQGITLPDNSQRSFGSNTFNNPEWLLNFNQNAEKNTLYIASLKNELKINDDLSVNTKINYSDNTNEQRFGLFKNTVGFENGYSSNRTVDRKNINTALHLKYNTHFYNATLKASSEADFLYEDLNYSLSQGIGFSDFNLINPNDFTQKQRSLHRGILRLSQKVAYVHDHTLFLTLSNNSYFSSIQNNKGFLPTVQFKVDLDNLLEMYTFHPLSLSASYSSDVNDAALLYGNQSHNSLLIRPEESQSYLAINDLFIDESLRLEEKKSYDFNLKVGFDNFNLRLTHFISETKNAVFPVLENNQFQLQNIAHSKNKGFEIAFDGFIRFSYEANYSPSLTFSTYRPEITALTNNASRVPVAGFSSVSKNLIVGAPAGVIVGSAYARDINNNIIIDDNGFPLVDNIPRIIGNPIPKFNLGFSNHLEWKQFTLDFVLDFQKGGDIWNGTQNVLNYLGTSQQSAKERDINNFVFNGVTTQGNVNTTPVDFYNPDNNITENRFVRYGFEGVAEDAIEDGSYLNLKTIDLTFSAVKRKKKSFFRTFDIGIYANNLITWTKFRGVTPYNSLFNYSASQGLNFFNTPLTSEVGLKMNLKI
ncbi:carboxypeptidase-like regulatory domain-containing protein [Seonamhaeicola sp. ML3]|uniref:carboxypeptidase-like regulatory domain-containing protein n=1 Tax=Seonamhaeicola sp. ML3 TaxID=2937786 RepID=UPI00200D6C06|nr:carboxypeptidase-like regulatory domain-containing protein [Seonamhaeicola sp. ML3]